MEEVGLLRRGEDGRTYTVIIDINQPGTDQQKGTYRAGKIISRLVDGTTVGEGQTNIPASNLGQVLFVDGRYVEFFIVTSTFGITSYSFTGAPNPDDITCGRRTPV